MKDTDKHSNFIRTEPADTRQDPERTEISADRLVYFAAERTLLAWVRVSLGLMALGFVVDRFSLFLKQRIPHGPGNWSGDPFSSWIGIVLLLLGVSANITAVVRYTRFEIRYHRNVDTRPGRGLSLGIFFTLATAVLGIIIVLFLILTIK